jgi:hypothetical protein
MDKKKLAIMQPYFFPYIGYFQLISAVDTFVIYDNIKYTKKGWINRNRILRDGKDIMFSLPLKKDSDYLDVCERELSKDFSQDKLLDQIKGAYQGAPYFGKTFPLVEQIVRYDDVNLFRFLHHSIVKLCEHFEIKTEIKISSEIPVDHDLKGQDKVLAICEAVNANSYINAIGGMELYLKETFRLQGIELKFIKSKPLEYPQFGDTFVPWLSIIDVLMFNPVEQVHSQIREGYSLLQCPS